MFLFNKQLQNAHFLAACLFISACSASDNTTGTSQSPSTGSFLPIPISEVFFSDTTVMVELLVFSKPAIDQSTLVEQIQIDTNSISEDTMFTLLGFNDANLHLGIVAPDGINLLGQFRPCEGELELEFQIFNLVAVSTDNFGETVTLVNTDVCGEIPGFDFQDIDGDLDSGLFATLLFLIGNPLYQQILR